MDVHTPTPQTDEEALEYLPDNNAARGLYDIYRKQGLSIPEAMIKTLEACVPQTLKEIQP